jgi:diketogulonate reductase-like aldo/keto reductase
LAHREEIVLATKVFGQMDEAPNHQGLSRKHILAQCDASLKRLGMDYIDVRSTPHPFILMLSNHPPCTSVSHSRPVAVLLPCVASVQVYQIHRFDANTPLEETMEALHDLVKSGKVRYIGASSMSAWQFAKAQHIAERNGWTKFITMVSSPPHSRLSPLPPSTARPLKLTPPPSADVFVAKSLQFGVP